MSTLTCENPVQQRARQSLGVSSRAIYAMAAALVRQLHGGGGRLCDVGCGAGRFQEFAASLSDHYVGVDVVRYEEFPANLEFVLADLEHAPWQISDDFADVTVAIETIEHLENPRAFFRELTRITRPGGVIVVTTPNQLSLLSKMTMVLKNEFNAFRANSYPAHQTALLRVDLERIARECGLIDLVVSFTNHGRIPGTALHWPPPFGGQWFSDNIGIGARKPAGREAR